MSGTHSSLTRRRFLFLQGPITPFFSEVAAGLRAFGHRVFRINLNLGDRLFWHGPDAVDYTARPEEWPSWIADFLQQNEITDILLLGEQRFYHSSAIEAAKALGIAVTVTDFGYLRPDWITLERNGMGGIAYSPAIPPRSVDWRKGSARLTCHPSSGIIFCGRLSGMLSITSLAFGPLPFVIITAIRSCIP